MTYQNTNRRSNTYTGANSRASGGYYNNSGRMSSRPNNARPLSEAERAEMRRRQAEAYRRAIRAEEEAARRMREAQRIHEEKLARAKMREMAMKQELKKARKAEKAKKKEAERLAEEAFRRNEIKVEKKKIPFRFILSVAIAFVLLLSMVFSFAQISEANAELAEINQQLSEADARADKLRLQLEEKNDLDTIELLAVEEYNMIKEGAAQKKYISLSEGDSIIVEAEAEEADGGFFNGMLSSVSSVFDDFFDYVK